MAKLYLKFNPLSVLIINTDTVSSISLLEDGKVVIDGTAHEVSEGDILVKLLFESLGSTTDHKIFRSLQGWVSIPLTSTKMLFVSNPYNLKIGEAYNAFEVRELHKQFANSVEQVGWIGPMGIGNMYYKWKILDTSHRIEITKIL